MTKKLQPVLSEGQWERVLRPPDGEIPDLEPDEAVGFLIWSFQWFDHADANEHLRIGKMMEEGISMWARRLSEIGNAKTNPIEYFKTQQQYQNLKSHQRWHYDMAERILALIPPLALVKRLEEERDASSGMEKGDPGGDGTAPGGGGRGEGSWGEAEASLGAEGPAVRDDG